MVVSLDLPENVADRVGEFQFGGLYKLKSCCGVTIVSSSEIFRIVLKEGLNAFYLSAWLNSNIQQIIFHRIKTGGIMGHLSQDALLQIKIPLPPLSVQNKIAEEVKKRMQKAEFLQKEAKEELENAKQEVEKMIIEG